MNDDITTLLHLNFLKNMEYLKEYHNDIFNEIEELSNNLLKAFATDPTAQTFTVTVTGSAVEE